MSHDRPGLSRRAVLLAGAWAAPVIVVATAAPAAAASVIETLRFTNFSVWFDWGGTGQRTGIAGNTTVFLEGDDGATVGPVTLVVSVPAASMSTTARIEENPTGWTTTGGKLNGDRMDYTFTWAALTVPSSAYSSRLTFHLDALVGADLTPPLQWSANAMATGAVSAGAEGSLVSLADRTADVGLLGLLPGVLARQGDTLTWSGASITYSGTPQPAAVEYFVELHGPNGELLALLANAAAFVADAPTAVGPLAYTAPADDPLAEGPHSVILTVVGAGGSTTASAHEA